MVMLTRMLMLMLMMRMLMLMLMMRMLMLVCVCGGVCVGGGGPLVARVTSGVPSGVPLVFRVASW